MNSRGPALSSPSNTWRFRSNIACSGGGIRSSACTSTGRIWRIKCSRAFKGTWCVCGSDMSKAAVRKKR
ncbi:MAG: hypothetical protein E8D43_14675 [Nitrospira sp.]|nr:MAG: hypothetical protein E8D43_14675 [Nitrospira sp.]